VDERTAELQHKNNELDLINRAKDRLFGVIGHDLRGPIGNLKGMLEILETQPDMLRSDSAPAIIAKLHKNASQSYTLLENLLQWAQNEHGLMVFNPEPFDLMNSVYESVALLESASSGKDVHIEILGTVDTLVLGDVRMVNTVLRNLVSNAIKFSDSGTNVQLVLKKQEAFTLVKVIDNGIGIPAENIPILLSQHDVFTTYGTLREKGSGLGLKLAKSFVERNGGEFGVESSVGKGSTFWFTVPLAQS
jgi:two-component system sensor histidine kinase/response regulator